MRRSRLPRALARCRDREAARGARRPPAPRRLAASLHAAAAVRPTRGRGRRPAFPPASVSSVPALRPGASSQPRPLQGSRTSTARRPRRRASAPGGASGRGRSRSCASARGRPPCRPGRRRPPRRAEGRPPTAGAARRRRDRDRARADRLAQPQRSAGSQGGDAADTQRAQPRPRRRDAAHRGEAEAEPPHALHERSAPGQLGAPHRRRQPHARARDHDVRASERRGRSPGRDGQGHHAQRDRLGERMGGRAGPRSVGRTGTGHGGHAGFRLVVESRQHDPIVIAHSAHPRRGGP